MKPRGAILKISSIRPEPVGRLNLLSSSLWLFLPALKQAAPGEPAGHGHSPQCSVWSLLITRVEWPAVRGTVRFLRRHEDGRGQAPSFGGVAETFVARNRGAGVHGTFAGPPITRALRRRT